MPQADTPGPMPAVWMRYLPLAFLLAGIAAFFALGLHRQFSLEAAFAHRDALGKTVTGDPILAFGIYVVAYVAAVMFAVPGAILFTMFGGFLFGWFFGALGGVLGATVGGAVTVLIGSASIGASLQRAVLPRFQRFAGGFRGHAFAYIVVLRLIPLVPYIAINVASAVFRVPLATFIAATAIGISPIAFCFGFIGSGLDRGFEKQIEAFRACQTADLPNCGLEFDPMLFLSRELVIGLALFAVLVLLPVIFRKRLARMRRPQHEGIGK